MSDSFLETNVPLLVLIEAAKAGDEKGVEEYAGVFADHANKLVEVEYSFLSSTHILPDAQHKSSSSPITLASCLVCRTSGKIEICFCVFYLFYHFLL